MSTDRTDTSKRLMGFLVPDESLEFWASESTYSEADPQVGAVLADRSTTMQLAMSGTPVAGTTLEILAQHGGLPDDVAQILHRADGDTNWMGHDPPIIISGATYVAAPTVSRCTIATTTSAAVLVAETSATDGTPETTSTIVAYQKGSDDTWTSVGTLLSKVVDGSTAAAFFPSLVPLPNGVLEVYYINQTLGGTAQLGKLQSLDGGATWEDGGDALLDEPISLASDAVTRLRVAASGGQHMALIGLDNDTIIQLSSSNGGNSFQRVSTASFASGGATVDLCDLVFAAGQFVALYWYSLSGSAFLYTQRFGSAAQPAVEASVEEVRGSTTHHASLDGTLFADESGRLWVFYFVTSGVPTPLTWVWYAKTSTDGGRTYTTDPARWYGATSSANTGLRGLQVRPFRGRALGPHVGSNSDLWCLSLGGWSSVTSPPAGAATSDPIRRSTAYTAWHAMNGAQPDDNGDWAKATTGAPTDATTGGVMTVAGGSSDTLKWTYAPGIASNWAWARVVFDPSGSGVMRLRVEVRPTGPAAPVSYGVTVVIDLDAGTLTMTDTASAATLGSAANLPAGITEVLVGVSVNPLAAVATEKGSCWYRDASGGSEARVYTAVATDETLTDNGGTTSTKPEVEINFNAPAAAAFDVDLLRLEANTGGTESLGGLVADPGLGGGMDQDDLFARPLSSRSVYLQDGQSVQALGVCRRNDSWVAVPTRTYAAANVLPHVLPTAKRGWRSNNTTVLQRLAFKRSEVDIPSRGLLGVYCDGQNSRGIQVELHTGGSWSSVLSVLPPQFAYESFGEAIIPDHASLSGDAEWYDEDELAGCTFEFADGTIRRIAHNRAGAWGPSDQVTPILYLEDPDGTEPTGTGTGRIWFPRTMIYIYLPAGLEWKGIRVSFDASSFEDTVDGDMRAHVLAMGEVLVFGAGPDETRALVREIGPELVEAPNGEGAVVERLTDRQRVELSWVRPIPLRNRIDGSFDFVRADEDGPPVADKFDAPTLLDGLVKRVGRKLLVYCPDIPTNGATGALPSNPDSQRFFGRSSGAIYGRIVNSSTRMETARGHANRCETVRGNVITFVEEPP